MNHERPDDNWRYFAVDAFLEDHGQSLESWVRQGGTLIATGHASEALAGAELGLTTVRRRRDVLDSLALYRQAAKRSVEARDIHVDEEALWEGKMESEEGSEAEAKEAAAEKAQDKKDEDDEPTPAEQRDEWQRRFAPQGAMLRGLVDPELWITAGLKDEAPVLFRGDHALLAKSPARVAVRLAAADQLNELLGQMEALCEKTD